MAVGQPYEGREEPDRIWEPELHYLRQDLDGIGPDPIIFYNHYAPQADVPSDCDGA